MLRAAAPEGKRPDRHVVIRINVSRLGRGLRRGYTTVQGVCIIVAGSSAAASAAHFLTHR